MVFFFFFFFFSDFAKQSGCLSLLRFQRTLFTNLHLWKSSKVGKMSRERKAVLIFLSFQHEQHLGEVV
jgi:hypothetical protein